ncbi:MAG TPA: hypothetical protein VMS21_00230, partial [Methylomirabilota bacterium]|nr:hypothetical protein [Methylomirabilota bacterium]
MKLPSAPARMILPALLIGCLLAPPLKAAITGQWDFESGDLSATIGQPIQYRDLNTESGTQFGTTGQGEFASVPDIDGEPAMVMRFPKTDPESGGYFVPNGAAPNAEGIFVNRYTIIMDVLFPAASSDRKRALVQTDSGGDADFFVDAGNGLGAAGFAGSIQPDTWHRIALAVDQSANTVAKFIDGVKVGDETLSGGLDGRWALEAFFWLFQDDDGETESGYLNSLQFRDEKLDDGLIAALGGPAAAGILTGPPPNPYVSQLLPSPESSRIPGRSTVGPRPLIQAILIDGQSALVTDSVVLEFDGAAVVASVNKVAGTTTVSFTPPDYLEPLSTHTVRVSFADDGGTPGSAQWQFVVGDYIALEPGSGAPLGSANTPGFQVRTFQAPDDAVLQNPNSLLRAIRQVNGTLLDASGMPVPNVAVPGPDTGGSYGVDGVINFEVTPVTWGNFPGDLNFPGIPGSEGSISNFTTEVIAFLELEEGAHRIGVSVSTDRADANDDDGFTLFAGANPRSALARVIGVFANNVAGNEATFNNNEFNFIAPTEGIYGFRLVHYQTGRGASLEWYSVDPLTGDKILVNDPGDSRAIAAWRVSTAPASNTPYVAEVSPRPDVLGVDPAEPIQVLVLDLQTALDPDTIEMWFNGAEVAADVDSDNGRTTIEYAPPAQRMETNNVIRLVYADTTGALFTNEWQFITVAGSGDQFTVTGQWDFDGADLVATVGQDLEYFDGATGQTSANTAFGTTTAFGIPDIAGQPANVMSVPGDLSNQIGYIMRHGIGPNGGGTLVNQYTLVMDVYWANAGPGFGSLVNYDTSNTSDGDIFFRVGDGGFGQGQNGYEGNTVMEVGRWHRVAFAVDLGATTPVVTKFLDGRKHSDWTLGQGLDGRRAMPEFAVLFGDNGDERIACYVNSIQVRTGKLPDGDIAALGGPSAAGIPRVIPPNHVTGQWDFNGGNLAATIGRDLEYFDGAAGQTSANTEFGTTTGLGVGDIADEPANVMFVPGDLSNQIGYIMRHGIAPNGGGTLVNQYTL